MGQRDPETGARKLRKSSRFAPYCPHGNLKILMLLWDIMSQMPGTVQDISSQENQDTRPITTLFSSGMLLTEKDSGHLSAHFDVFLSRKGEAYVFYTVVSREWHQLAARCSLQSHY